MLDAGQGLQHGRYQIKERISQGGMGTVYLAIDRNLDNRVVAVKENTDISHDTQKQFKREAGVLARLTHPNLPRVTDYFIEPSGCQYLVMDYVPGDDLRQVLRTRGEPFSEADALAWLEPVMDALAYLHGWVNPETGQPSPIVHRDIKPANIKRTPNGRTVLVDFGLAKFQVGEGTLVGARAVTPGYSPLEQYVGGTDARSDIYALGATLYALITGERPPEAPAIAGQSPLVPPHRLNPKISRRTERVILRAMKTYAADRYQTIREMYEALYGTGAFPRVMDRRTAPLQAGSAKGSAPLLRPHPSSKAFWALFALLGLLTLAVSARSVPLFSLERLAGIGSLDRQPQQDAMPADGDEPQPTDATSPPVGTPSRPATLPAGEPGTGERTAGNSPPPSGGASSRFEQPAAGSALLLTDILTATQTVALEVPSATAQISITAAAVLDRPPMPATETSTATPLPTLKPVSTATQTPVPSPTATATPPQTATPQPTHTATLTPVPPPSPTQTTTATPQPVRVPVAGDVIVRTTDDARYVFIPGGEFAMGSEQGKPDEQPVHQVALDSFWIMQTEVTNVQFGRCVAAGACAPPDDDRWNDPEYAVHPVTSIEWADAVEYAAWAGGRLPTEAEWELAARGFDNRTYPWGEELPAAHLLNFDYIRGDTVPVGTYSDGASPFGVLDLSGNVEEWVADWYANDYYARAASHNPQGPESGVVRVLRGGSYKSNRADVRAAVRGRTLPNAHYPNVGFRVVLPGQTPGQTP